MEIRKDKLFEKMSPAKALVIMALPTIASIIYYKYFIIIDKTHIK